MMAKWITASVGNLIIILASAFAGYAAILTYIHRDGLQNFSKISSADFAMTIAAGTLFGVTIASPTPTPMAGLFAIASVCAGQGGIALMGVRSSCLSRAVGNPPFLREVGREILPEKLLRSNVTESDLYGELLEVNAMNFNQVKAVVFETMGDGSDIHCDCEADLDEQILAKVIGHARLFPGRGHRANGSLPCNVSIVDATKQRESCQADSLRRR